MKSDMNNVKAGVEVPVDHQLIGKVDGEAAQRGHMRFGSGMKMFH